MAKGGKEKRTGPRGIGAILLLAAVAVGIFWYLDYQNRPKLVDGVKYQIPRQSDHAEVVGCVPEAASLIIQSEYRGKPVTRIAEGAFAGSEAESIHIPESVTELCNSAFAGSGIKSIDIPDAVTDIGESAFAGCAGLTAVTIPDSVARIGSGAFKDCSALQSYELPRELEALSSELFMGCASLTCFTVPDTITGIPSGAFEGCSGLTELVLPDSVQGIGSNAFRGCTGLTAVTISGEAAVSDSGFDGCLGIREVTYTGSVAEQWCKEVIMCSGQPVSLHLCEPIWKISESAFENAVQLADIDLPDSLYHIGNNAFKGCTGLTALTIPDTVKEIGWWAFADSGLTEVCLPGHFTEIERGWFSGCPFTTLVIPDFVESVGYEAFRQCESLTSVEFPESVREIGKDAFSYCKSLTSVDIPETVKVIGAEAFSNCERLSAVTIAAEEIGERAFDDCKGLTDVTLADGVRIIDDYAFSYTDPSSIIIPASAGEISGKAFGSAFTVPAKDRMKKYYDYDEAVDLRGSSQRLTDGDVSIIPLDDNGLLLGKVFCALPPDIRTLNAADADYVLTVKHNREARSDYSAYTTFNGVKIPTANTNPVAFDTITDVFLCALDGEIFHVYQYVGEPPTSGYAAALYGDEATAEQIWEGIRGYFGREAQ